LDLHQREERLLVTWRMSEGGRLRDAECWVSVTVLLFASTGVKRSGKKYCFSVTRKSKSRMCKVT
jgi:hypothetical protein